MGLGELGQGWIVSPLVSDDGRVGFDDDFVLVAIVDNGALLAEGVEL